ncbi:MAG: flavodoxin family protein [Candidatus Methanomethylophilus sp.]|nr:flavodoxin family protein [Methanomethylophilus sp.]
MKILIMNGSPHSHGNTAGMIGTFKTAAEQAGHEVTVYSVCQKHIAGCRACEYCHTEGHGVCAQKDDMAELLALIQQAEMIVFASPIYYFGLSGQLQCALHRTYAIGVPQHVRKVAMLLSSGSDNVYDGALFEYRNTVDYWQAKDVGVVTAYGAQNGLDETKAAIRELVSRI